MDDEQNFNEKIVFNEKIGACTMQSPQLAALHPAAAPGCGPTLGESPSTCPKHRFVAHMCATFFIIILFIKKMCVSLRQVLQPERRKTRSITLISVLAFGIPPSPVY